MKRGTTMKKFIITGGMIALAISFLVAGAACRREKQPSGTGYSDGLQYTLTENGEYSVALGTARPVGTIVIPAEYKGKKVTAVSRQGFANCERLEKLVMPDTITSVGADAFYGCKNLSEIDFSENIVDIPVSALRNCHWFEEQEGEIYAGKVFLIHKHHDTEPCDCSEIRLKEGTEVITKDAFYYCENLRSLEMPDSVRVIENCFSYCPRLSDIRFSSGVTTLEGNGLKNTDWYSLQPDGPLYVGKVLFSLKNSSVEDLQIREGTVCVGTMAENEALKSVVIPDSVEELAEGAFENCPSLKRAEIGEGLRVIPDRAFADCPLLSEVILGKNVEEIGREAFYGAGIGVMEFPESVKIIGVYSFAENKKLTRISLNEGLQRIENSAFINCALETLALPDSLVYLGGNSFANNAFPEVTLGRNLEEVRLPFSGCTALEIVRITRPASEGVFEADGLLGFDLDSLTAIYFPDEETMEAYRSGLQMHQAVFKVQTD